jgi:uncharacterized membrane protein YhhN
MSLLLIGISLLVAIINWIADSKDWVTIKYVTKPSVILALIGWLVLYGGLRGNTLYFIVGLCFSLFGDILFMLPKEQFIAGLIAFLFAHIAYILGLSSLRYVISAAGLILLLLVVLNGFVIFSRISNGLTSSGQNTLRIPVLIYTIVIGGMLVSALLTMISPNSEWNPYSALLVSLGAILFFVSDSSLAWNKFVVQTKSMPIIIMITYHIAQITITLGAGLNFPA